MKKETEKNQVRNNPSQEKLISLLMDAYAKGGKRRSLKSILLEAGYSPESAKNPKIILSQPTVNKAITDFVATLQEKRDLVVKHAFSEKKIERLNPSNGAYVLDVLIKNGQLLSGKDTSRLSFNLDKEEKEEIDKIFAKNKK